MGNRYSLGAATLLLGPGIALTQVIRAHRLCALFLREFAMRIREEQAAYATKRAANLSVNAELLDEAKALGINLSVTLEKALTEAVRAKKRAQWLEENREAIAAYDARVERDGTSGDFARAFKART